MSLSAMKKYSEAKNSLRECRGIDGDIPVDNVMHSMWSGIDVTMNGELVSTTNQKCMYKSYFENILNNSSSTKIYQLKTSRYFGDDADKDENDISNLNTGMQERSMPFRNGQKVELMGFILSDIMGIQAAIVN